MKTTLESAVTDYHAHLVANGYTDNTLRASHIVLNRLVSFHGGHRPLVNVTDNIVDRFMAAEAKRRKGAGLVQSHNRVKAFFMWAERTGRVKPSQNPMNLRRAPRKMEVEQQRVDVSKFPYLMDAAEAQTPRDRALVAIGLFTLLRDSELRALKVGDLRLDAGRLRAVIFKSRTVDDMAVSADLDVELRRWLQWYSSRCGTLDPNWYLLPALKSNVRRDEQGRMLPDPSLPPDPARPMGPTAYRLRAPLLAAGCVEVMPDGTRARLGGHTLRRSGARALYDALVAQGRPDALRIVQTQLHHASAIQTQHYIGVREDRETRDDLLLGASIFGFDRLGSLEVGKHGAEERTGM